MAKVSKKQMHVSAVRLDYLELPWALSATD